METKKPVKRIVMSIKFDHVLVAKIDAEAEAEGLTRSTVIRRVLLRNYAR